MNPVPLHKRTHPNLDESDCFGCKAAGVRFGTVPTDSPKGRVMARYKEAEKGMNSYAYKKKNGGNPVSIRRDKQEKHERRVEAQETLLRKGILEKSDG